MSSPQPQRLHSPGGSSMMQEMVQDTYQTDYHVHTARCGHAGGAARDYVLAALSRGLSEIAFTDHVPLYFLPGEDPDPGLAMTRAELPGYVEEVSALREEFAGRIDVLLGLEADYAEGYEAALEEILRAHDWDVVLGSVHWVAGGWIDAPGSRKRHEIEGSALLWGEYYRLLAKAATSRLFDVITHFDLPKKFGHRMPPEAADAEAAAVDAARAAGVAIEVSSAGLRKTVGEEYPAPDEPRRSRRPDRLLVRRPCAGGSGMGPRPDRSRGSGSRRAGAFELSEKREKEAPLLRNLLFLRNQFDRERGRDRELQRREPAGPPLLFDPGLDALPDPPREILGRGDACLELGDLEIQVVVVERPVDLLLENAIEVGDVHDHRRVRVGDARHGHVERVVVPVAREVRRVPVRRAIPLFALVRIEEAMGRVEVDRAREEKHRQGTIKPAPPRWRPGRPSRALPRDGPAGPPGARSARAPPALKALRRGSGRSASRRRRRRTVSGRSSRRARPPAYRRSPSRAGSPPRSGTSGTSPRSSRRRTAAGRRSAPRRPSSPRRGRRRSSCLRE